MKRPTLIKTAVLVSGAMVAYRYFRTRRRPVNFGINDSHRIDTIGHYDLDGASHDYDVGIVVGGAAKSASGTLVK